MSGKAALVRITERQQDLLRQFANARNSEVSLAQRSRIVLLAFEKCSNEQISVEVGLNPDQVGRWRRRWQQAWEKLIRVECSGKPHELADAIKQVLADLPRSGRPRSIEPEQQAHLFSTACEDPEES